MKRLCDQPGPKQFEAWQMDRIYQLEDGCETTDALFILTAHFGKPLSEVRGEEGRDDNLL